MSTNANYSSESEGELSNNPVFRRDAYVLAGAQLTFGPADRRWELRGFINNIFDEVYYTSQTRSSDVAVRYTGRPRTYGLSASFQF